MVHDVRHGCRDRRGAGSGRGRHGPDPERDRSPPASGVDQEAYLASGSSCPVATDRIGRMRCRRPGSGLPDDRTLLRSRLLQSFPDARPSTRTAIRTKVRLVSGSLPDARGYLGPRSSGCGASSPSWSRTGSFSPSPACRGSGRTGFPDTPSPRRPILFLPALPGPLRRRARRRASAGDVAAQAASSSKSTVSAWTAWRAPRIVEGSSGSPQQCAPTTGIEIMLNTLAFPASDFDGLDVRRGIAAQDLACSAGG